MCVQNINLILEFSNKKELHFAHQIMEVSTIQYVQISLLANLSSRLAVGSPSSDGVFRVCIFTHFLQDYFTGMGQSY